MRKLRHFAVWLVLIAFPGLTLAQGSGDSERPVTSSLKTLHSLTATNIMKTAEMLDDEMYAFSPTEEVRTAGQILAHIANAQFGICSVAAGEENPSQENYEESATERQDILAALEAGFDYCEQVYDGLNDEQASEMRNLFGMSMTASAVLAFNSAHNYEHYGNLVTYMRINGIVPPSSM